MEWFFSSDMGTVPTDFKALALGLVLSFVCGQVLSWVYMTTHSGLSYSRSFVNSLIVIPVIVALVMQILQNSLVTAFGMMAVFAIVRFRNILRDTLDTSYILTTIVVGMACGTMKFASAAFGTLLTSSILIFLWATEYGARHRYDAIVNFHWNRPISEFPDLENFFNRHVLKSFLANQRITNGPDGVDFSYRLRLRDPEKLPLFLDELKQYPGVSRVTGLAATDESEV